MKRRLFIAINLPEEVKNKLIRYQKKWTDLEPRSINWVIKPNLHITLIFLGYVTDDEMYEICNIVKETAKKHEPFFINLERIIVGPPNATPRMFWAEGKESQELADLQNNLENALASGNLAKKESRAYRPHITLARFKYDVAKKLKSMPVINELLNIGVPVETIELMQSDLRRTGPEYTVLESVNLGE